IPLAAGFAKIASKSSDIDNYLHTIINILHNYCKLKKDAKNDDIISLYYAILIYNYFNGNNKAKIIVDLLQKIFVNINFKDNIQIIHRQIFDSISYSYTDLAKTLSKTDIFLSNFFE
ncbi:MAG: hypothetical protein K6G15_01235, partial [Desulfovibrio sp.]|nr:hypothetical protein [Desulfovibrio sp.]